jgi:hypothetical protein
MTSYNSVTFNSNGSIADTSLEEHVRPNNVLADNQRHTVGIQTNTKSFSSFNTGSDAPAQTTSGTMRVQLHQDDGLVRVGGLETKPEVAEALRKQAPELFVEPAVQQAQAQAKAEEAKAEEISREELNRHPDEIEGYHQHINGMVSQESLIGLMVYAQKGEAPRLTC